MSGLSFDAPSRELRLAVYDGDRKPWWVRIAPDGTLLAAVRPIPEGMPRGHFADPAAAVKVACEALGGLPGYVEPVERRLIGGPRALASALGRIGGVPWELELDEHGLLVVTGSAAAFADELAADPVEYLVSWRRAGLITLTEGTVRPALAPVLPDGPVPEGAPARFAPTGREYVLSAHERFTTDWALHVLPDGRIVGGTGLIQDIPSPTSDPMDAMAWAGGWTPLRPDDQDFRVGSRDVLRGRVFWPSSFPLVAWFSGLNALEVAAGGNYLAYGDEMRETMDALLDAGFRRHPLKTLRDALPGDRIGAITLGARP